MKTFSLYNFALTITIGLLASGCASINDADTPHVNQKSFGSNKIFAVVSIASLKTIQEAKGMSQMFKSADAIPGANTRAIINKLNPKVIRTLGSSKHFTLLPENKVLASKTYKNFAEDEKITAELFMSDKINVANKYKYVSDEQSYSQLAKDLDVDGVIGISMHFAIAASPRSVSRMGLSLGKQYYSVITSVSVIAYNSSMEVIWKDSTIVGVDPDDTKANILIDTSGMTSADFEKFHPSAIEVGGKGVDVLLARLDDMMAGQKVSRMRTIK
jgi:hypothetical protein